MESPHHVTNFSKSKVGDTIFSEKRCVKFYWKWNNKIVEEVSLIVVRSNKMRKMQVNQAITDGSNFYVS